MKRICLISIVFLSMVSCTDNILFQGSSVAPEEGWNKDWKPEYMFTVNDTLRSFNTFLDIRHTTFYPYSNLFLFVTLVGPDGQTSVDTVECPLAAPDGTWYGKGLGFIHEDRFESHILYKHNNRFPQLGEYTLRLEQAMRRETLDGILNVGVSVEFVDS